ncbi:CopD family protein [Azoarcus olearius]|uniref:Protoporphyrinogen IX oxidase n=1 Tax=Azoarcus sp. (strain BH72) TaxID=418699 RepID=A1K6B6_AZOSB|nr:CopD family protein [Azoarcus olearius]ANQ84942.1 hypothetical protein dqs_1904 [Azoarcus olearius]CAL94371.1 conserved hypothetical membrane protein [Azoarcus olearius]
MTLLKALHLGALICWCGSLLYLPALVAAARAAPAALERDGYRRCARQLFVVGLTPAALVAIMSGTGLFLAQGNTALWLVAKLGAVAGMAVCHVLCGALVLNSEQTTPRAWSAPAACHAVTAAAAGFIGLALWLVLAKPF